MKKKNNNVHILGRNKILLNANFDGARFGIKSNRTWVTRSFLLLVCTDMRLGRNTRHRQTIVLGFSRVSLAIFSEIRWYRGRGDIIVKMSYWLRHKKYFITRYTRKMPFASQSFLESAVHFGTPKCFRTAQFIFFSFNSRRDNVSVLRCPLPYMT